MTVEDTRVCVLFFCGVVVRVTAVVLGLVLERVGDMRVSGDSVRGDKDDVARPACDVDGVCLERVRNGVAIDGARREEDDSLTAFSSSCSLSGIYGSDGSARNGNGTTHALST